MEMLQMIFKVCIKCNENKNINDFNKSGKGTYKARCRICLKLEYNSEYHKIYRNKNSEIVSQRKKKCYEEKKNTYLSRARAYRALNLERYLSQGKNYYYKNQTTLLAKSKIYRYKNKEELGKKKYKYKVERLKTDILFKLKERLRYRTYSILKSKKLSKTQGYHDYIGCTVNDLFNHLQSKFDSNMNWNNYGSYWVIDHIIPLASATNSDEVYKLCHYTNLQPLEKLANLLKSDKME